MDDLHVYCSDYFVLFTSDTRESNELKSKQSLLVTLLLNITLIDECSKKGESCLNGRDSDFFFDADGCFKSVFQTNQIKYFLIVVIVYF